MPRPRSYSDEQLREAVSACSTLKQVCARLGLTCGGQTYELLRRDLGRMGLALPPAQPRAAVRTARRSWTDAQLRDAVGRGGSLTEVCQLLGLTPGARRYEYLRRHMARLDIDSSHLPRTEAPIRSRRSWSDDELRDAVRDSRSVSEVLRRLGFAPSGGMHRYIKAQIQAQHLDTTHFLGQSWSRGRSYPQGRLARPLDQILAAGSTYPTGKLRTRLIAAGLKQARCEHCTIDQWRGRPIPLALDHINGDPTDHRLENLRILCPNCHAQTETWCRSTARVPAVGARDAGL